MLVFALGLVIEGYTHGVLGENSANEPALGRDAAVAPASIAAGGPIIEITGSRVRSYSMPARTVALSFDDGPDPMWTLAVLAVLRRYHVPATFFVIGAHAAAYPSLIRTELAAGDEVGSHTYTHTNLASAVGWREGFELALTQNALAGAAAVRTRLLRMPFSSVPDALTAADWQAAKQACLDGYTVVVANLDTRDWARPGINHIVAAAMPSGGRGAVIMFHDGGGDRAQTVAALAIIIPRLRSEGYRFTTITNGLGQPPGDVPATTSQKVIGTILVAIQQLADHTVAVLAVFLVLASALTVIRLIVLVASARVHRRRDAHRRRRLASTGRRYLPDVSVVIPAWNEAAGIAATVRSMADSGYPGRLEIVVVDDGSTDETATIVRSLRLPFVRVIRQKNTGKPGALNRGIAAARSEILVLVDADTIFEPATIERLIAPMRAADVGAVSGNTKVGNRRGILGGWQHLEYVMGFNLDRRLFDLIGTIPTVPGAIGAFRRDALATVGGVSADTMAEDTDLTMAICRSRWRVVYAPDALAWTEAPTTLRELWRQRYRWSYGTMQAMWKHRRAVFEHGQSGRFGRGCLTYLAFFHVLLPLMAPVVDVFSLYGLVFLNPVSVALFWLSFTGLQSIAGGYALRLDGERLRSLWVLPLQQIVYRQLMYLVTIQSVISAMLGNREHWRVISRAGVFAEPADATPAPRPLV